MSICHFCWTEYPRDAIESHQATAHAGWTKRWGMVGTSRNLTLIDADGIEHPMSPNEVSTAYKRVRANRSKRVPPVESPTPAAAPEGGSGPAVDGPSPAPVSNNRPRPMNRIYQMAPPANAVTRGVVEAAFTREFLAETLVQASRVLSEWDGAGVAGTFSAAEAAQISLLIYDPTVTLIIDRFDGRVDRFKMMLAGVIIAAGRGRAHVSAITARSRARAAAKAIRVETAERETMIDAEPQSNGHGEPAPLPGSDGWLEWVAAQQSKAHRA